MKDLFKKLTELDDLTDGIIHSIRFTGDEGWELKGVVHVEGEAVVTECMLGLGVQALREFIFELKQRYNG